MSGTRTRRSSQGSSNSQLMIFPLSLDEQRLSPSPRRSSRSGSRSATSSVQRQVGLQHQQEYLPLSSPHQHQNLLASPLSPAHMIMPFPLSWSIGNNNLDLLLPSPPVVSGPRPRSRSQQQQNRPPRASSLVLSSPNKPFLYASSITPNRPRRSHSY